MGLNTYMYINNAICTVYIYRYILQIYYVFIHLKVHVFRLLAYRFLRFVDFVHTQRWLNQPLFHARPGGGGWFQPTLSTAMTAPWTFEKGMNYGKWVRFALVSDGVLQKLVQQKGDTMKYCDLLLWSCEGWPGSYLVVFVHLGTPW